MPPKVVIVGIDGAEWRVLERLRAAGRVPALERLIARGVRGSLGTFRPTLSPALWTTVATGMPAGSHGIESFVVRRPQARLALRDLPAGDVRLHLGVVLEPPCGLEGLQVYLDGARLRSVTAAGDELSVPLPAALRGVEPQILTLRLPARCAARPRPNGRPATATGEARPWGTLTGVRVAPAGGAATEIAPQALVLDDSVVPVKEGLGLVGRPLAQVESGDRRVPALWNVASARGRSVGVIGWWCTWPAEPVNGTVVSDFLFFASTRRLLGLDQGATGEALETGAVFPPAETALLGDTLQGGWEMSAEELAEFVPRDSPRFAEHLRAPARVSSLADPPLTVLKDTFLINRPYFAVARRLAATQQPDLLLVYTNLVDAVEHKFWRYYEPARFAGVPAEEVADFGDTIPRTYAFVDRQLALLLGTLSADSVVMVLSDHGHHAARDGGVFSGEHSDAPPGILVMAGPGIRAGAELRGATLHDIAPTVLAVLGLPVAGDMPGHVLEEAFVAPPRIARVATYGDLPREPGEGAAPAEIDPAVRERLRALGYL